MVERGNLLSHTAIVGRELGIPTVIAVEGATQKIRDGQPVTVNAVKGTVTLAQQEAAPSNQATDLVNAS